jgi:hypothetical protein
MFEGVGARFSLAGPVKGIRAEIERLAGDLATAETLLRTSRDELEAMGHAGFVASRCAQLAIMLARQGRLDEAEYFTDLAQQGAQADDLLNEALWRRARAGLLARRGASAEAEALAREAVDMLAETDALNERAESILDLAYVLQRSHPDEAATLGGDAVRLYRRKGHLVGLQVAQELANRATQARS